MKYSEFKREVEKLGFTYNKRCEQVAVKVDGQTVMDISTGRKYIVDNEWNKYQQLSETTQEQLFDLAYQLAKTPLAEREGEKRYRLTANLPQLEEHSGFYLNRNIKNGKCTLGTKTRSSSYQTIFTESEIAEMNIAGFDPIEVKDE